MSLNDRVLRSAKPWDKAYRLADGGGLYMEVSPAGGKWWRWKYRFGGKEKRLSLGVYPDVSRKAAREGRETQRQQLSAGIDPGEARKAGKRSPRREPRASRPLRKSGTRSSHRGGSPATATASPDVWRRTCSRGSASDRSQKSERRTCANRSAPDREPWHAGDGPPGEAELRAGVPLRRQAVAILHELEPLTIRATAARPDAPRYGFPGAQSHERPMSENAVLAALRRMGYAKEETTGHGFRSMASTLVHEQGWNHQAVERQLAHAERNAASVVYNFAEHLPERHKMMQAWADYLDALKASANVIPLFKRA